MAVSTSATASANEAATSGSGISSPASCRASTQRATAVLSPENEKSAACAAWSLAAVSPRGKRIAVGVALAREPVDVRAAGVGQAEQPADLVERLPRRVVERRAELGDVHGVVDEQQRRVAAGDDERHDALRERAVDQLVDDRVPDHVVDAVQRLVERERERLGGGRTDGERADEARAGRDRDRVDLVERDVGGGQRALDRRHHGLEVGARGDLGDDPAEPRVLVHRAGDGVDQQVVAAHEGDAGLVAGRLDPEHEGVSHAHQDRRRATRVTTVTAAARNNRR